MMPALFELLAHHVAGRVLQEDQWRVDLVGELDELCCLVCLLAEQHAAMVGENADGVAVQLGEAGDERRAVQRLELVEVAVVDNACDHVAWIERNLRID